MDKSGRKKHKKRRRQSSETSSTSPEKKKPFVSVAVDQSVKSEQGSSNDGVGRLDAEYSGGEKTGVAYSGAEKLDAEYSGGKKMDAEYSGGKNMDAEYSGMKEPPLIKQLKRILSEYPDNGQIIKELIQNAEDAEAKCFQVIYDQREINREYDEVNWFTKFFKGPALCVTNDAKFTEEDWIGIKMIASSVKEKNKLKVGKFGMGFKSVFHMTDFPCIISGDRMLLIDPTEHSNKINAILKLKDLRRYRGIDLEAFLTAFSGTVQIGKDTLREGYYNGTVFWFPLRDKLSKISPTIYDEEKTMDLFMSFAGDASETLIFLCHLESISLKIKKRSGELESVITVSLEGDVKGIIEKRRKFVRKIGQTKTMEHDPITCSYDLALNICREEVDVTTIWRVLHYYMGNNSSEKLVNLTQDPDLGFCPCVGIAFPLNREAIEMFKSRIFCFLPLSTEGIAQTGLPVHVNSFFALNQSRHHLKWPTEDQRGQKITDPDILWNQVLIEECLVKAYQQLIQVTQNRTKEENYSEDSIELLYRLIPNEREVLEKWKRIPEHMRDFLSSFSFLFTDSTKQFISLEAAQFATFQNTPSVTEDTKTDIIKTLKDLDVSYVQVDVKLFDIFSCYSKFPLKDLTPESLADILRRNLDSFRHFSDKRRYSILTYLLGKGNYSCLRELPLIKVTSGNWKTFERQSTNIIFLCHHHELPELFSPFKDRIVVRTDDMVEAVWKNLEVAADRKDLFQLRLLSSSDVRRFLIGTLEQEVGSSYKITKKKTSKWFQRLWKFLDSNPDLISIDNIKDVKLIPFIKSGTWKKPTEIALYPIDSYFLEMEDIISTEICACFKTLGITVLPELPSWIPKYKLRKNIFPSHETSVMQILSVISNLSGQEDIVLSFNSITRPKQRDAFVRYLAKLNFFDRNTLDFIKKLKLFHRMSKMGATLQYVAVCECRGYSRTDFPVKLPLSIIKGNDDTYQFLIKLGVPEKKREELAEMVLNEIERKEFYEQHEIDEFMNYFLGFSNKLDDNHPCLHVAKRIPFLKTESGDRKRPQDLFDPDDLTLKDFFLGEPNKFPVSSQFRYVSTQSQKRLGLMGIEDLNADDFATTASLLDRWVDSQDMHKQYKKKSTALMKVLEEKKQVLHEKCQSTRKLSDILKDLKWIFVKAKRPRHFPPSLQMFECLFCRPSNAIFSNYRNECLVGSVMPLIQEEFKHLGAVFGWSKDPAFESVVQQLLLVKHQYKIEEKSSVVPLIDMIYDYISQKSVIPAELKKQIMIWTGAGFEPPQNVVIFLREHDLETLLPYFFHVPPEFLKYSKLFEMLGCHLEQSVEILGDTLNKIKTKHVETQSDDEYEKDYQLIIRILNRLAERKKELSSHDILLPTMTTFTNRISFTQASNCTADRGASNYTPIEGDDSIVFVSDRISVDIAKVLGAKPLNKQILSGTDSLCIEGFGQSEKLTDRLRKLVEEGYKDGVAVPKELIQNADDAGATVFKLLFDEREHCDAKSSLFSRELAECQGPSICVYNNASFTKSDFENITKLNAATKESDSSKIGRFGLGFCAVYNLTDVPSFVSKSSLVIFDPHKTYIKECANDESPGIRVDFSKFENKKLLAIYQDQFEPFQNIFGFEKSCLTGGGFEGTLFRFPLRTMNQARMSEISKKSYSKGEVQQLLSMFIRDAGNMLLFTQNITKLEVHYIPRESLLSGNSILLFTATKTCKETNTPTLDMFPKSILQKVHSSLLQTKSFREIQRFNIKLHLTDKSQLLLLSGLPETQRTIDSNWTVVWETGNNESLTMSKQMDGKGILPLSAAAVLCNRDFSKPKSLQESSPFFYAKSRFFCFLPLPIETGLPVHINGSFDVSSDRQRLASLTDDDKTSMKSKWNESLLVDAAVNALFALLESFAGHSVTNCFYQLWPIEYLPVSKPVHDSFFKRIIRENRRLFYGQGKFVPFSEVMYLDPEIRENSEIGKIGFQTLLHFGKFSGKVLVDVPGDLVSVISTFHDISRSSIKQTVFLGVFLEHIEHAYWQDRESERIKLIIYCLKSKNKTVHELMKQQACIPIISSGILKRPGDLVNPSGIVASLFAVDDEVFPHRTLQKTDICESLVELGMVTDTLPDTLLVDRCLSVKELAVSQCTRCAMERCQKLMKYIKFHTREKASTNKSLAEMHILPVLSKPDGWKFTWHGNEDESLIRSCLNQCKDVHEGQKQLSLCLGNPASLYRKDVSDIGGTVVNIVDEDAIRGLTLSDRVLNYLGLPSCISVELIVRHLCNVSGEYEKTKNLYQVMTAIYRALNSRLSGDESPEDVVKHINKLEDIPVILIGKHLFTPSSVAFEIERECVPDLNQLPQNEAVRYKRLFEAMGVRRRFTSNDIIRVFREKKDKWKALDCQEIEQIIALLHNLSKCENYCEVLKANRDDIVAPDTHGRLCPIYELVIADETFIPNISMRIVHESVPHSLARKLGVKEIKLKCFEKMSIGIPFGQKEKLVSRLGNLLKAYPCDSSIMKELLQNADDAGATEMNFIKDFRKHPTDKIFDPECSILQDPSLCVFNNKPFTEDDLQGIQNLGEGSKRNDPTKTGQYGVGFNAVYHLTDIPSFITKGPKLPKNGLLCIFDPTCSHLPGVTSDVPGIRINVHDIQMNFPDVLSGFLEKENIFENDIGTLFRLPLRIEESEISKETHSPKSLNDMVSEMTDNLFAALLFVKHVKIIKISNVTTGNLVEEYHVKAEMSEEDCQKRTKFFNDIKNTSKLLKDDKTQIRYLKQFRVGYDVKLSDSQMRTQTYHVVQMFGFDNPSQIPESIIAALFEDRLVCLPLGGVAYRTSSPLENDSKAFCFLPLPGYTNLPVHVNGHFVLDHESRRSLWKGTGMRQEWNECIVKNIIVPAYIQCIYHWKSVITTMSPGKGQTDLTVISQKYHNIFPIFKEITDEYWRLLTSYLYKCITNEHLPLFPVFCKDAHIADWTHTGWHGETGSGFFNSISKVLKIQNEQDRQLERILKDLGMKLIHTPLSIKKSIEDSGTERLACSSPDETLSFVATHSRQICCCNVGELNSPISKTRFRNFDNVVIVLLYLLRSSHFMTELPNLPVLVTADEVLRYFSTVHPVYCSEFSWMFPCCRDKFICEILECNENLRTLMTELMEYGYLSPLTIHKFEEFISSEYRLCLRGTGPILTWNKNSCTFPSPRWIASFWKFIHRKTDKSFIDKASKFADWCFLPAKDGTGEKLVRIDKAWILIKEESFKNNGNLHNALRKLSLPALNRNIFVQDVADSENGKQICKSIEKLVTIYSYPERFLDCLYFWVEQSGLQTFNSLTRQEDTLPILEYFSRHFEEPEFANQPMVAEKLKALPIHLTVDGKLVQLGNVRKVYEIPADLPLEGLDMVMKSSGVVFLKEFPKLGFLYTKLSVSKANTAQLYSEIILPKIRDIPEQFWLNHIKYIKNNNLASVTVFQDNRFKENIKQQLLNLPFIPTPNGYKRCSEFYDHTNSVFLCICDPDLFLPEKFRLFDWFGFISNLGLKTKVTDGMILSFARQVESSQKVDRHCQEKSCIITDCFRENISTWSKGTLEKIRYIKFIVPAKLPMKYKNIFPQKNDGIQLICMNGAVEYKYLEMCWSTADVLPFSIQDQHDYLGIPIVPKPVEVLKHIQNISTEIQSKIKTVEKYDINCLMQKIYSFLNGQKGQPFFLLAAEMLSQFPIVYILEENRIVTVDEVVIQIGKKEELSPYLCKLPFALGQFVVLFESLGVSSEIEFYHCTNILSKLQIKVENKEMLPQELKTVKEVLLRIYRIMDRDSAKVGKWGTKKLYLPNKDKKMCESTDLVVCNNKTMQERMGEASIDYFVGFKELDLLEIDPEKFVRRLPENLRPKLLTDIVTEQFDKNKMVEVKDSILGTRLSLFIHSSEFILGVCRIAKKFAEQKIEMYDRIKFVNKIKERVLHINVTEVSAVETVLLYKGEILPGTNESRECFSEKSSEDTGMNFFYKNSRDSSDTLIDIICSSNGLARVIIESLELPYECEITVVSLLRKYEEPGEVGRLLDKEKFPSLEIDTGLVDLSAFPKPGTYVEEKFHPFLEQALDLFSKSEFMNVALELEDANFDCLSGEINVQSNPVYIYVHILREIPPSIAEKTVVNTRYLIDKGSDESDEVTAFRLYRFVRRQTTSTTEISVYAGNTPEHYLPFDENSRRIETILREAWSLSEKERRQLIRRLLLQWHPDRNRGSKDYACKVFYFIKKCIEDLVEGEQANRTASGRQHSSSSSRVYFNMFDNIKRRATKYARAYYNNLEDYNRSHDTGNYNHKLATNAVVKDENEARRWMKQAKRDFQAASTFLGQAEESKFFNWICFTCHQASEKALKSALYGTNANMVSLHNHSLTNPANQLSSTTIQNAAREMKDHVGNYNRMRYPNWIDRPNIPSDVYTKEDAEKAVEIAKKIIAEATEIIGM